jgi:hypothetical protein
MKEKRTGELSKGVRLAMAAFGRDLEEAARLAHSTAEDRREAAWLLRMQARQLDDSASALDAVNQGLSPYHSQN